MRLPHDDPELAALVHRYVTPGRRYLRLGGSLLRRTDAERAALAQGVATAAAEITADELDVLLQGGWRERRTAAWLIAVARRTEFRERIGELLLASEVGLAGQAYCVTLAHFATPPDADLLIAYLERYLRRTDLHYDQTLAMGALMHLDNTLGTSNADRFLAPDGLWPQWNERRFVADDYRKFIAELCAFVDQCANRTPRVPPP